jgi:FkbM family methyltransferase
VSQSNSFRTPSLAEQLARKLPSGGVWQKLRRHLKPLFEKWVAADGGLRSVLPGGEIVVVSPQSRHISWNPEEYSAFRASVRPGDVVLEAGANVGAYTVLFGQWVGPTGRVFAFEPDPAAHSGLVRHIQLNGLADRVTAVQAAIADEGANRMRFALFESSGTSRLAADREEPGTRIQEVDAVSVDAFCKQQGLSPTVIKIDVEGAELAALRGARTTIAQASQQLRLFAEMHPHLWPQLGITPADIQKECEQQGLAVERLNGSHDDLWTTEGVCLRLRRRG